MNQATNQNRQYKYSPPNNPPEGAGAALAEPPNEKPVFNGGGFPMAGAGVSGGVEGAPPPPPAPPKVNAPAAGAAEGVVEAGVEVPNVVVVEGPQVTMVERR